MFVSRPKIVHGQDYRVDSTMSDARVRGTANVVASNVQTLTTHTSDVTCLAFSKSCLATCSNDKTIRLWAWGTQDFTEAACSPLLGHTFMIHCCAFSPSGSVLATCSTDGSLRLWDAKTGEALASLTHPNKCSIRVCQFSPDDTLIITGGDDDTGCLWNVTDRKFIRSLKGHDESVTAAAFSPDSQFAVTATSGGDLCGDLLAFDAQYGHGKFLHRLPHCHDLGVACVTFSPTYGVAGKGSTSTTKTYLMATGGKDNLVKLWHFTCQLGSVKVSIKLATMLPGHKDSVLWVDFSPNGSLLASCSLDKTVRLWNADTQQAMLSIDGHTSYVSSCAFSKDSKHLASASSDKTVKIWQLTDTSNIMEGLSGYEAGDEVPDNLAAVGMESWQVDDVCDWLASLGLEEHKEKFHANAIDGRELLGLSSQDLENSLGVSALGHRNKLMRSRASLHHAPTPGSRREEPVGTPEEFLCPISQEVMADPVIAADGYTYDRAAILAWLAKGDQRSPMTNIDLPNSDLTPNRTLKMMIQKFLQTRQ